MLENSHQPLSGSCGRGSGNDEDGRIRQLREMIEQLRNHRGTIGTTCQLRQHIQAMDCIAKDILDSDGGEAEYVRQLCGQVDMKECLLLLVVVVVASFFPPR